MKKTFLLFSLLVFNISLSQSSTSVVPITETYSSNGEFLLKSISYDDEFPTLRGESFVFYANEYANSSFDRKSFYQIDRSFDLYDFEPFFVAISNDGRKIIYIKNKVYWKGEEHKNVTYYVDGKLIKAYSTEEFIDCDKNQEKCEIFYNNEYQVYKNRNSSTREYKDDITDKEKFLYKNFVFNKNDTIYVIDERKKVTLFDLNNNKIIKAKIDFDSIYPKIKNIESIRGKVTYYHYPYKYLANIENSITNKKLCESISEISNLKYIALGDSTYGKYKLHKFELTGYIDKKGKFEIEDIKTDDIFDQNKLIEYIKSATFKTDFIPYEVDKIYVNHFFGGYRNYDDKIAEEETIKEKTRIQKEIKKRLKLDTIDGIYIPKNLYECMTELDKTLSFENKKQLKEAETSFEFNSHLGGLGMWIRNNWGLNGGSRLLKYFKDRKIGDYAFGNDTISGIIIAEYIKWLKGDKNSWKKWEKENPVK